MISNKSQLRQKYKEIRNSLKYEFVQAASGIIINNLMNYFNFSHKQVAIYYPIDNEVDLTSLNNHHIQLLLPKIKEHTLEFVKWDREHDTLVHSEFSSKIMEPNSDKVIKPDIIFVPLIAADLFGNRIGYGKGHYDYTLEKFPKAKKIGVGFSEQLSEKIDAEPTDHKLNYFACDKFIVKY